MTYNEAIWSEWFSVAEPLNRFVPWCTFIISVLWYLIYPIAPTGEYRIIFLTIYLPGFVMGILAGIFYLTILRDKIEARNLENSTLIWLLICFGLSLFTLGGIFIWIQFLLVGILSDRPIWKLFQEKYRYY
ncbi:MAG: hypothetical protein ACTSRS_00535 [Candidatus Helarchaeota archaeon]